MQPLKSSYQINPIDIVIGCTGSKSFHHSFISFLSQKCLLINASSWDLEFPKNEWIAAGKYKNSFIKNKYLHCLLEFSIQEKQLLLPNAGYPINFSGLVNSSPPQFMQLTVALMLAGALQSLKMKKGEFLLNKRREEFILEQYLTDNELYKKISYFD